MNDARAERTVADLEKVNAELRAANAAKTDFMSRMSHELRTPLNAILGFAQLLELDDLSSAQQASIRDILRGGWHLLDLINEILDISRIEAGNLGISLEPVLLGDALAEAVSLVRPLAAEREVTLHEIVGDLGQRHVLADQQRLKQVLLNLLSNAIKYNRRGGSVSVAVSEVDGWWLRISVADDGPGIPPEMQDRVFEPFERLGAETTRIEGTGLGLALARGLVETMGGAIELDSVVGHGSIFSVELLTAVSPAASDSDGSGVIGERGQLPPGRLLLIEDNIANVRLIERLLERDPDVELITAMHGTLGLELARQHDPDVVLLDMHLPDMSGREVLRRLGANPATSGLPVVVLSADATDSQVTRMLGAGVRAYLTKPLDITRFREVLHAALTESEAG